MLPLSSDSLSLTKDVGVLVENCVPIGRMMKSNDEIARIDQVVGDSLVFRFGCRLVVVRPIDVDDGVDVVVKEVGAS